MKGRWEGSEEINIQEKIQTTPNICVYTKWNMFDLQRLSVQINLLSLDLCVNKCQFLCTREHWITKINNKKSKIEKLISFHIDRLKIIFWNIPIDYSMKILGQ